MDDLQKNLQEVGRLLSKIKLWAAIAGLCAAALLGVYSFLGWQYWEALDGGLYTSRKVSLASSYRQASTLHQIYNPPFIYPRSLSPIKGAPIAD
jgi:hypothetical protein